MCPNNKCGYDKLPEPVKGSVAKKSVYYASTAVSALSIALLCSLNFDDSVSLGVIALVYIALFISFVVSLLVISYFNNPYRFRRNKFAIGYMISEYVYNVLHPSKYWDKFKSSHTLSDRLDLIFLSGLNKFDKIEARRSCVNRHRSYR
jgi:hypothetical protein